MFYHICFLLYVSKVCCPRCKYSAGIKLAWYFFLSFLFSWLWSFKGNGPSMSIFNTLHSLFLWYQVFIIIFFLYFLGLGGGLSWGNCPLNFKWQYRKIKVMGCVVLRVLQCVLLLCLRLGSACHCGQWWGYRLVCLLVHFLFLLSFLWRHHVLVLCLYECFDHFHGGRILYLCSCTILFFSARKSVMYEIKPKSLVWK